MSYHINSLSMKTSTTQQAIGRPVCTWSNDSKFEITPTMKFGIAKLTKTFYKNIKKSLNAKDNNNKDIRSIEDTKVNKNWKEKFCHFTNSVTTGPKEALPPILVY